MARRKKEWFDNEAFWEDYYPMMFSEDRFAKAGEDLEKVLELTKPKGRDILDLCCGPGRFAVPLARAGYNVTGVDRTKFLLDKARRKARSAKVKIQWVQADMRDFVQPESFDLVLNMFTSFGYFDNREEDCQVLRNIHQSLKPGGACIIETVGKEWLAKVFTPSMSYLMPDGTRAVQIHEIIDDWTRIRNEWILIRKGRARTYRFHHSIYTGLELRDRMEQAGFSTVELYGNLEGDPYDYNAQRLVAVGRKG